MPTADELTEAMVLKLRASFGRIPVQEIADFCGVDADSAVLWFTSRRPLGGVFTLRLMYLLEASGLDVPEIKRIRDGYPLGEYLARLLAYKVITMSTARAFSGDVGEGAILRATRDEGKLSKCTHTVSSLEDEYGAALEAAVGALKERLGVSSAASVDAVCPRTELTASVLGDLSLGDPTDDYLTGMAVRVAALSPEVIRLLQLSPQQRARFRELVTSELLFQVTTNLGRLNSVRAFQEGDH